MNEAWRRLGPALLYLALALPATLILNLAFVNFHAPDDYDHVKRAYTLVHDPFRAVTPPGHSTGAMIDTGLTDYVAAQRPVAVLAPRPLPQAQAAAFRSASQMRWSGVQRFSEMSGAISYFPILYAPQTVALELGRWMGATVEESVFWARLANGLVGIALAALGLRLLPFGHSLALVVLLLPRTLLQFASNSADPILYGLALIVTAMGLQATGRLKPLAHNGLAAVALFVAASVRPPIAALGFTPMVQAIRNRQWPGLLLLGLSVAAAASWALMITTQVVELRCGAGGSPIAPRLAAFATGWPWLIGHSFADRGVYYFTSFIGHYGWGDGPNGRLSYLLPPWMYVSAVALLMIGLRNDVRTPARLDRLARLSLAAGAAGVVLITFLAMYVACRGPLQTISGVQGRYFVPALFAIAPAISGLAPAARDRLQSLFPILLGVWVTACVIAMSLQAQMLYRL
ncbi:MAG TPA: DUF2142 domain-containing protein [Allosphingosinicella sp.]|jgi:hypothetical protein|nr:DUF2142 domain-containing protein [Allosphingosinicella sp.]